MDIIIYSAFIAALLPFIAKAPVAIAMQRLGGYDNRHPRDQQQRLTGFGARALAAHQNSFESLIIYGIAIGVTLATNTVGTTIQVLAVAYIISRILYCIFYYLDWHFARSSVWLISLICPLSMILLSAV